ncbi:hypothetical protein N7467_011452 [Penicillium canescens]|nr:hypothetical protein N7467_011452 [Penicillium canescens]
MLPSAEVYFSNSNSTYKVSETLSFMKTFIIIAGISECYFDISDTASCETHVVKPAVKYTKLGITKSREWWRKVGERITTSWTPSRTRATAFVTNFTHYDLSARGVSGYLGLAQAALKTLIRSFGSSSSSAWADISSTGLSFASGIVAAIQPDVAKIPVEEGDYNRTGDFCDRTAWVLDGLFIAKASTKVNGPKPSAMDLMILDDEARTCDKNDMCYFFIIAQDINNISGHNWVGAKGLDKLTKYNITPLEFTKSAAWFQDQFSGYLPYPNSSALLHSLQSKESRPSLSYFVNVPVVDLDKSHATKSNETYSASNKKASSEETFLSALAHEVSTLKSWPYSKMSNERAQHRGA